MKRLISVGMAVGLLAGLTLQANALTHIYKWLKDKQVNSDAVLSVSNSSRVVPMDERSALAAARSVLTKNLFMTLAEYHKTKQIQDGETTPDTVLPEEVAGRQEIELADEDYRFLLEIRFKAFGGRTRVFAKASPVYRIHDVDAEELANGTSNSSSVEVKIKGGQIPATISMGQMFIIPIEGSPLNYQIQTVPEAAERAALLVRSFMYLLDKEISAGKKGTTIAPEPESEAPNAEPANPKATAPSVAPQSAASTDAATPSAGQGQANEPGSVPEISR